MAQEQNQRCTLAGTVLNSATNAGIPHALVTYFGAAQGFRFTDTGGNFDVENVPCQPYTLMVSKPGFVSGQQESDQAILLTNPAFREATESQSEQAGSPPKPANITLNLTPDSPPQRILLIPLAAINGTVLDENSEPLAGVVVQAIAVKASFTGTGYVPAKTAHTDDRGHYELLDLTPGDFVVRLAGEASSTHYFQGIAPNPNNDHRGMQPVYYSNVDTLAAAQVLHLAPAENASADFRHATEPAFDVNGRLSGFVPQVWTQFKLYRDGDRLPLGRAFVNLTTGQFRLTDIPRGSYTLRVLQYQADPPLWLATEQPFAITAQPIQNFVVQLSGAVAIPVSVSYEAGAKDEADIEVLLQPQHSRENRRQLGMRPAVVRTDVLTNVIPDQYRLTVQVFGGSGYVSAAKLGDLDVLHSEFSINGSPGELRITVRGDSASVEGNVTFQGKPAVGAQVYLTPTNNGAAPKSGVADPEGHYKIAGVAPGDYRIRAWTGSPSAKEVLAAGDTLSLQRSEQRTMALEATAPEQK